MPDPGHPGPSDDELDDGDSDLDLDPGSDDGGLPGPHAAYAVNWTTVLAVDAAMGAVVALGGVVAMLMWNFALGVFLTGLGLFYVCLVARRGQEWQQLRRQAGL